MASSASSPIPSPSSLAHSESAVAIAAPAVSASARVQNDQIAASAPARSASGWEAVTGYAENHPQVASALIGGAGSLVVGTITLIGVALTLAHAHHKMKRELQAQRLLAKEERAYSANQAVQTRLTAMRQDLYLKLIEEHQAAVAMIAGLPSVHIGQLAERVAKMNDLHALVQKTSLMSESATSDAASEAHSRLNELMFGLLPLLPNIQSQADEIAGAKAEIARLQLTIDTAMDLARGFQEKQINGPEVNQNRELLHRSLHEQKMFHERRIAAANRQSELTDEYTAKMLPGLKHVAAAAVAFFALARQELGMTPNSDELKKKNEQTFDRAMSALSSVRKEMGQEGLPPPNDSEPA